MDFVRHTLWLVPLILIGMVSLAVVLRPAIGQPPSERVSGAENQKAEAEQGTPSTEAVRPTGEQGSAHPASNQYECKICTEYEKADLYEQRRMAKATERQFNVAVVGTTFLVLSVVLSAIAAWGAMSAAKAANEANKLNHLIFVSTERAWVRSAFGLASGLTYMENGNAYFDVGLEFVNMGRGPAYNVSYDVKATAFVGGKAGSELLAQLREEMPNEKKIGPIMFPRDDKRALFRVDLPAGEINATKADGAMIVAVAICINYEVPASEGTHQTGYSALLVHRDGTTIDPNVGNISKANLMLTQCEREGFAT